MTRKDKLSLKKCVVGNCGAKQLCGMYTFPKDEIQRKSWLKACNIGAEKSTAKFICWRHFEESDFKMPIDPSKSKFGRLKPGIVPSKLLPEVCDVIIVNQCSDLNLAQCEIFGDSSIEHSIITLEENEKPQLSIDHSYSATETSTADKKVLKRLKICEDLLQEKRKRNRALVQRVRNLKQKNAKMKQGNFSQNFKNKIASDVDGRFTKKNATS